VNSVNSSEMHLGAYWALREIQFGGLEDPEWFKGVICTVIAVLREYPGKFSEDDLRRAADRNLPKSAISLTCE